VVALRIGAQLLEPQAGSLEVARQVLQSIPGGGREPARGEQPRELRADFIDGL